MEPILGNLLFWTPERGLLGRYCGWISLHNNPVCHRTLFAEKTLPDGLGIVGFRVILGPSLLVIVSRSCEQPNLGHEQTALMVFAYLPRCE